MRLKPTIALGRPVERHEFARSCYRSPNIWILICSSALVFVAYQYCNHAYSHDPTSLFFDPAKAFQRRYSLKREEEAHAFISAANTSTGGVEHQIDPLICIGLSTSGRTNDEQYVRSTIGSLLEGLSNSKRRNIHLTVFIAQTETLSHTIQHEPWLRNIANQIIKYELPESQLNWLRDLERNGKVWEKSMFDYEYLLRDCLKTNAQWIMTVEDHVLAVSGWYDRAKSALDAIAKHTSNYDQWLYLRLFYTEKFLGWNREYWGTYLGWSILTFVTLFILLIAGRIYSPRLRRTLSNVGITIICCLCLPSWILLYFAAGRVSMQPPATGLQRMEKLGCCAQGLIYPRKIVPQVINKIHSVKNGRGSIDVALEGWADEEGWARYALIPPLLQDIGLEEGVRPDIWNFAFENYPA